MNGKEERQDGPLSSEALKRDEWRGGDNSPGGGPTEREPGSDEGEGDRGPNPIAGTMLPPD